MSHASDTRTPPAASAPAGDSDVMSSSMSRIRRSESPILSSTAFADPSASLSSPSVRCSKPRTARRVAVPAWPGALTPSQSSRSAVAAATETTLSFNPTTARSSAIRPTSTDRPAGSVVASVPAVSRSISMPTPSANVSATSEARLVASASIPSNAPSLPLRRTSGLSPEIERRVADACDASTCSMISSAPIRSASPTSMFMSCKPTSTSTLSESTAPSENTMNATPDQSARAAETSVPSSPNPGSSTAHLPSAVALNAPLTGE